MWEGHIYGRVGGEGAQLPRQRQRHETRAARNSRLAHGMCCAGTAKAAQGQLCLPSSASRTKTSFAALTRPMWMEERL